MRGKGQLAAVDLHLVGITPAHAGKSLHSSHLHSSPRDHPRTCGEKSGEPLYIFRHLGSPPHMRGKEERVRKEVQKEGITPAHAGKRILPTSICKGQKDHPRMCGEKKCCRAKASAKLGSPPHVRGKAVSGGSLVSSNRITPACAGKSVRRNFVTA